MRSGNWITTIMQGKIERKPGKGRPKSPFTKQMMDDIGIKRIGTIKKHKRQRKMEKNINSYLTNHRI